MKLRLPHALLRALMACFTALVSSSLATASTTASTSVTIRLVAPDVEQDETMLCWAASAAGMLAMETGQDAAAIYRCITEASGNAPGYVESALSWYKEGAQGKLEPQAFDGSHTITRSDFESLDALARSMEEALKESRAASMTLYAGGDTESTGHAVTVYASEYENGRLYFSYVDSADGVPGVKRAEVIEREMGFVLEGTNYAIGSLISLGEDGADDAAPTAPVGSYMHNSPTLVEYRDIAAGHGVYRFAGQTSLITYRNGEPDYQLQRTPTFAASCDAGYFTLVNNGSFQLTVQHNGIMDKESFSARYVGDYAQKYSGVGIRDVAAFNFSNGNPYVSTNDDYRVERLLRLATDAPSAAYCTDTNLLQNLDGQLIYRAGGGLSGVYDTEGNLQPISFTWYYPSAGIFTASGTEYNAETGVSNIGFGFSSGYYTYCTTQQPLPSASGSGDSGSPLFVYNEATQQFEIVGVTQGGDNRDSGTRYNATATEAVMDLLNREIAANGGDTIYIEGAKSSQAGETITDGGYTATLYEGRVTQGDSVLSSFNGVALDKFTQGTWSALDADTYNSNTWYTYNENDYLNIGSNDTAKTADQFGMKDLVYTSSLQFMGQGGDAQAIELKDNVDLGAGHVQFSLAEGVSSATFDLGRSSSTNSISSAGFVVDKGVTLNNYLTYGAGRELRRTGEGTMNIVGTGNNDVLLNIGGAGLTYLNRENGYGAYNVFVGTGATLRLDDINQVERNVTLGAGGGTLDLYGNNYNWTATSGQNTDGSFSLTTYESYTQFNNNLVTRVETAAIANLKEGTVATLTIGRTGDFEFVGAFRDGSTYTQGSTIEMDSRYTMMPGDLIGAYKQYTDAERHDSSSVLKVVYNGGGTMTMTGVYTILTGSTGSETSGMTVTNGSKLLLQGTNTIHARDTASDYAWGARWSDENDWHFAMAEMDVEVDSGSTFELGHHALLIGDVNVAGGGTYVMKQGVNRSHEFVEGWYIAEDMSQLADYYGHKGDTHLESGANMSISFDEGVSTTLSYAGNITGAGSLTVDAGEGKLELTGQNTFSGSKTVASGYVYVAEGAEGDTTTAASQWKVQKTEGKATGVLALEAVKSAADIEKHVHSDSNGILALTHDVSGQVSTELLPNLIIGAAEGKEVHYGDSGQSLQAVNGTWTLGGGGGTLVVDFLLEGESNKLVLGTDDATGIVRLTNRYNTFGGGIEILGGVMLEYTHIGALGKSVEVSYGGALIAPDNEIITTNTLKQVSDGVLALPTSMNLDLTAYTELSLGAKGEVTLSGSLTVASGADYRFGGSGTLTVATQLSGDHGIVVDGQGNTGSAVVMGMVSTATGGVTVQGYRDTVARSASTAEGDVTLSFTVDNAVKEANPFTVKNNGMVNLNGTSQLFNNLTGDASAYIYDNVGGGALTLNNTETSVYAGNMVLDATNLFKTGSGTLELSGTNSWKKLTIAEGIVQVTQGTALGAQVAVQAGGTLHVTPTADSSLIGTLSIAGNGVDGSGALVVESFLNGDTSTLNLDVAADASILLKNWRDGYDHATVTFKNTTLNGNTLTVKGDIGEFTAGEVQGSGGRIVVDGVHMKGLGGGDYSLKITKGTTTYGGTLFINGYKGGETIALELDDAEFYMGINADGYDAGDSTFAGTISVGPGGATINNNSWAWLAGNVFNLTGKISGEHADSTLYFKGWERTINVSGGMELAGTLDVANGLDVNVSQNAVSVKALTGGTTEDTTTIFVKGTSFEIDGNGSNYTGIIELLEGGQLKLSGLADGSSMGSLSTLKMTNGVLTFASLTGYTGGNALMNIGTIQGTRQLEIDASALTSLRSGQTYHLLTSANDLSGWTLLNDTTGSRLTMELISGGTAGAYTLDLKVTGQAAISTWKGTGTLADGTTNASLISSNLGDNSFYAQDALVITSDAGQSNTLTLSGVVNASSVSYTGAGTVRIVPEADAKFAEGIGLTLNATGRLELDKTTDFSAGGDWGYKTFSGAAVLEKGTLSASTYTLNAFSSVTVTGADVALEIVNPDSGNYAKGVRIEEGARLSVSALSEWGATMGGLAGSGTLVKTGGNHLTLKADNSSFTGSIEVQQGALYLGAGWLRDDWGYDYLDAFKLRPGSITVHGGATLVFQSAYVEYASDINWKSGSTMQVRNGVTDNGLHSTLAYTFSGTQTLDGELKVRNDWGKVVHVSGLIQDGTGSGILNFVPEMDTDNAETPAFILSGDNTYSGGTIVNRKNFTLYAAGEQSLGTGAVTLTQGTLSWANVGEDGWDGDLSVSGLVLNGGALNTNGYNVDFSKTVSGGGALVKQGLGVLTLSGNLSYTGETQVQAGRLVLGSQLGSTAGITVAGDAFLRLEGDYLNGNEVTFSGSGQKYSVISGSAQALSGASGYRLTSADENPLRAQMIFSEGGDFRSAISSDTSGHVIFNGQSGLTTFHESISGEGLAVRYMGNFELNAANSYTGGSLLVSGSLQLGHASALGTGNLTSQAGTTVSIADNVNAVINGVSSVDALVFGSGSAITLGAEGTAGQLSFGSVSGTGSFTLDIFSESSYDRLLGDLSSGTLNVNLAANELGTYELVKGAVGDINSYTLNLIGSDTANFAYSWNSTANGLTLTIGHIAESSNIWSGGSSGVWDASSTNWNGGSAFNTNLKETVVQVAANQTTAITVAAVVSTPTLFAETAEGATLSFSNDGGSISADLLQKDGAGTLSFASGSGNSFTRVQVNEGTLSVSVADGNPLGTNKISGNGTFELAGGSLNANIASDLTTTGIRITNGASLSFTAWATATMKNIEIEGEGSSLILGGWANLNDSAILLRDGGTVYTGENGFGGDANNDGAYGSIYVENRGVIKSGNWGNGDIAGTITGKGTLSIVDWNGTSRANLKAAISDAAGGALALDLNQNNIHVSASNTYSGGTTISGGSVTVTNSSAFGTGALHMTGGSLTMQSALSVGSLSGESSASIARGEHTLTINQTEDGVFAGSLSGTGSLIKQGAGSLTLSNGDITAADLTVEQGGLSISGAVTLSGSFTHAEGTTVSLGALTLSGEKTFHMTHTEGTSLAIGGVLTLGSGSTLNYSYLGNYTAVDSVAVSGGDSLTLNLNKDLTGYLTNTDATGAYNAYDLGADLTHLTLTVAGHEAGTYEIFRAEDGHSYLRLTEDNVLIKNYKEVAWDAAWGDEGLAGAPAKAWEATLSETTGLYSTYTTTYDNGTRVSAKLAGEAGKVIDLYALMNADDSTEDGSTVSRNTWLEVTGGSFGVIAAANLNNWEASTAWNIIGDMHLQLTGEVSVDAVAGLAHRDAENPSFTGNAYVSIGENVVVKDSVVGGGIIRHGDGMTLTGNTHVVIHSLLADNNSALNGDGVNSRYNAVIGGHSQTQGIDADMVITGSTDVLVDVAGRAEAGSFDKTIIGGNRSFFDEDVTIYGSAGRIDGDTNVTINADGLVTFTEDISAGSTSPEGSQLIGGNSTLTVNGGVYSGGINKFLIGGSWITGGTSEITGTASIILGGDTVINRHVFVAGYSGGGESIVGATRLEIGSGVTIGDGIKLSGGFTSSARGTVEGARTLALHDGVDLSGTTSTLENFDHIEVVAGTATLNAAKFVNLTEYTKTGAGTLVLKGSVSAASSVSNLTVSDGTLQLLSDTGLRHDGAGATTVVLNGGLILGATGAAQTDFALGSLSGGVQGKLDMGNHNLTINQTEGGTFSGSLLTGTGEGSFTKDGSGSLQITQGDALSFTDLTVNAGSLRMAGVVTLSGVFTQAAGTSVSLGGLNVGAMTFAMNQQEGTTLSIDALTLGNGSTLTYTGLDNRTTIGDFAVTGAGELTLNVAESVVTSLDKGHGYYDAFNLGVTLANTDTITVTGFENLSHLDYEFGTDATTGNTTLVLIDTNYSAISWDENWGTAGLDGAPVRSRLTTVSGNTSFYNNTLYDDGSAHIVAVVTDSEGTPSVFATADSASIGSGGSLTRDAWLKVTGGSYGIIAGANNGSGVWNVTGDIHLDVEGGTVNSVVGYSHASNGTATLTGDTYVSVHEGATINDSVIGGGVMTNGNTVNLSGSTHVFIYDVLDTNAAELAGDKVGTRYNAVIGGHASGTDNGALWNISGSTNVTVDLTGYTGESTNFVKAIYGGNVSSYQWGNINGSTSVLIDAADDVTFTDNIVAGSRQNGTAGVVRIDGDSTLTINGGTFAGEGKYLVGGNWVEGSEAELKGRAAVILNGGVINRDVYAAGISNDNASTNTNALYVGSTLVQIGAGATLGDGITVSGGFGGTTGRGAVKGERTLNLQNGVNLSSSTVSFKDFDRIEVEAGNHASLKAESLSNMATVRKTGAGELTLGGSTTTALTHAAGSLTVAESGLTLGGLAGTAGTARVNMLGDLTISQATDGDFAGVIEGDATFTKAGTGALTLSGTGLSAGTLVLSGGTLTLTHDITLSKGLNMNQLGLEIGSLTLADGATLSYTAAAVEDKYTTLSNNAISLQGALTLDLSTDLVSALDLGHGAYNDLVLGVKLSSTENIIVSGLEEGMTYTFGEYEGLTTLKLANTNVSALSPVEWDANWNVADAPAEVWHTVLTENTGFYGRENYDDGSTIAAAVTNTTETINVFASVNLQDSDVAGVSLTRDAWLEVSGGTYGVIGGANINNWGSWGSQTALTGDIHLLVNGGNADYVVGFSHKDAQNPLLTGDTYVSVYEGATVNDSVIGGGISQHGHSFTIDGDTHVFVYGVLANGERNHGNEDNKDILWADDERANAVIGANVWGHNAGATMTLSGSSAVTVDVSGGSGSFEKHIYGGNASYALSATIGGGTGVSITANENVSFAGNVVAGSYTTENTDAITGDTVLTINGGSFSGSGYLTGGSVVAGGTSSIGGTASVILNGGSIERDVYAAGISNGGSSTVGNSLVEIGTNVSLGTVTVSGGFGGTAADSGTVTGPRTLALQDGVNLSTTTATFSDFDHIKVESGNASMSLGSMSMSSIEKVGEGALTLSGSSASPVALTMSAGTVTLAEDLSLGSLSGTAGTVEMGAHDLTISQTVAGEYAGGLTGSGTLTKQGEATLKLTGSGLAAGTLVVEQGALNVNSITLSGDLAMNQAGLSIDSLTMAAGTSLLYTEAGNLATVGDFTAAGALTLNLSESVLAGLAQANGFYHDLSLGVSLGEDTSHVSVTGLADNLSYSFGTDGDGKSTLRITDINYSSVAWDPAWNKTDAPANAWHTTLDTHTGFYGNEKYDDGTNIIASVKGTEGDDPLDLFATVNLSGVWDSAQSLERNAWLEVTGGTYGVIAGAYFNNWGSGASSIKGDLHFMMKGGSVNDIIGFSYKNAKTPTLEGSTYISVYEGATVHNSIIGGSELQHNAGVSMTGNTNIYIYGVLDSNPETLDGSSIHEQYNAVIGGHSFGTNEYAVSQMKIAGSTNITVDVSAYEGAPANFVKSIYGGHLMGTGPDGWGGTYGFTGIITEGTHVMLDANELVSFTADIVAGSKVFSNNTDTISGGTSLTIDGGIYAADSLLTGGSWNTGGTSAITGGATVTLNGGSIERDVYAAGIAAGGTSTVDYSLVEIGADVTLGTVTVSGGFGGTGGAGTVTSSSTLALQDGVNLSTTTATFSDFDHIKVESGNASMSLGSMSMSSFEKVGEGSLTLSGSSTAPVALIMSAGTVTLAEDLSLGSLSGTAGTVEMGTHDLTISQTVAGEYAGGLTGSGTLTKQGEATLKLTGSGLAAGTLVVEQGALNVNAITLSGDLAMNQAGLSIDSLTMASGTSLLYTEVGNLATVGDFSAQGSLTLNLSADLLASLSQENGTRYNDLSLGVKLGDDTEYVSVTGLASGLTYSFTTDAEGKSILQIHTDYAPVAWDPAWNKTDAPAKAWHTTLETTTGFYGNEKYDDGTSIIVSVTGTSGIVNLYASSADGSAINRHAWLEVTGGEFGVIAGSSSGDNGGGNISGDVHIMMNGGEADRVIAFSNVGGSAPVHSGSSYISIGGDAIINDSVIGASVSERGGSATLTGDTHVYVYNVQSVNGELNTSLGYDGDDRNRRYNAIIGGFARITDWGVTWNLTGNTNVVVDVDDYSGQAADFVKNIYGGNVSDTYSHMGTLKGNTNVSISANELVTFTGNIVAGSLKGGDHNYDRKETIDGDTSLTIVGGVYAGENTWLTGGSMVTGDESEITGTASVILGGDASILRDVYAAGVVTGGNAGEGKSTVGSSLVEIGAGVSFGEVTVSGGFGGDKASLGKVTGNRTLSLADGVDLSASSATIREFTHIDVASGSASLNASKLAAMQSFTKSGDGALTLGGTGNMASMGTPMDITVEKSAAADRPDGFAELTISAPIVGDVHINKNGDGTMKLSGDNSFGWGFVLNAGTLIAEGNSSLGVGSVDVASGATLEIARDTYVNINHHLVLNAGSEFVVHSLKVDDAALAANNNWGSAKNFTLTLASDIELSGGSKYLVLSGIDSGIEGVSVNHEGAGRYTFETSVESNALYLTPTQDANRSLVWDGSETEDDWNQLFPNKNWNTVDEAATDISFMNQDTVQFTDAAASKKVAVDAAGVQVASMTVSGSEYSFSGGEVKASEAIELQKAISLKDGASLNLGDAYTVTSMTGGEATLGPVKMTSDSIAGLVEGGQSTFDYVTIDIAKGTSLELKDIVLAQNARITDDPATVSMDNVTVQLGAGNFVRKGTDTLSANTALVLAGGSSSFTLASDMTVCTVLSSALDSVNVTGTSLTLDFSGLMASLEDELSSSKFIAISFGEESLAHFNAKDLTISATGVIINNTEYNQVYVKLSEHTNTTTLYIPVASDAVPEPTTATLSLLALSMLMARRRRK